MQAWLLRFTRTPWSGALIGASTTAALQSSSATTTVATVGFVQAPLMPPLVALGTCLRLVGWGRLDQIGFALAGIGVIFLGIDSLQKATAGHGGLLQPDRAVPRSGPPAPSG